MEGPGLAGGPPLRRRLEFFSWFDWLFVSFFFFFATHFSGRRLPRFCWFFFFEGGFLVFFFDLEGNYMDNSRHSGGV